MPSAVVSVGAAERRPGNLAAALAGKDPAWSVSGFRMQADEHVAAEPARDAAAVAAYTIPAGGNGFYAIENSALRRDEARKGNIDLEVRVRRAAGFKQADPASAVATSLNGGELFDFDTFLGYLTEGDAVTVSIAAAGDPSGDRTTIDYDIVRVPAIPVTVFPDDLSNEDLLDAPGRWFAARDVQAGSAAARRLAWGRDAGAPSVAGGAARFLLEPSGKGDGLAAFRVPHSGYYALHETWLAGEGAQVEARIYVGNEAEPHRIARTAEAAGRTTLDTDLGYIAKGDVIHVVLANTAAGNATATFAGSIVEWAPRRPPLRARRGGDGLLNVFEPESPRRPVDIPSDRWVVVPAQEGDATNALRQAFAEARRRQRGGDYAGVRLERGKTYVVASEQVGGAVFLLRDVQRLVLDGNGATLRVASPELTRKELDLFSFARSRDVVLADFAVEATSVPFTTGEIIDVQPRGETTQTVTFRVNESELDPLKDISPDGRNNGYAYNPTIPGRLAPGTWTHYPGNGNPSIRAADAPGVFTHRVTRTNGSIEPGKKWLIKNKRAGLVYLTTRAGSENITLSGIDGRAAGGGQLRFWQTSGINLLDCRFEPEGKNWISSSADGVHGRGREGVWIENTTIRGVCEDIMNTYGQNMIVIADSAPDDAVMSIRMFARNAESFDDGAATIPTEESLAVGDQLVFFNPQTGGVLGYAGVVSIAAGRHTLTNPVPGIQTWTTRDGKRATMVYNTRVAGRFFVRDTRMMDSMRFGVYVKARGGVVFGSQFEGLSAPGIFAVNEPEWPEGPPATHLWVQGCTFSQNNHGYMPRHRDFMVVDPADISIYTRRLRDPGEPDDHRAHLTHGEFANSHVKLIGNVFHDWRGMGISVRNSRNVRVEDNRFLAPLNDDVMRRTLAEDPALAREGQGTYAAIFLDSVGGVRVSGNRFHGLPVGDGDVVTGQEVTGLAAENNVRASFGGRRPVLSVSFDEWFGDACAATDGEGRDVGAFALRSVQHRVGRLGGGLYFSPGATAALAAGVPASAGFSLWVCPDEGSEGTVLAFDGGARLEISEGRWRVLLSNEKDSSAIELGPVKPGLWQHVAIAADASRGDVRGYVDGLEVARIANAPADFAGGKRLALGGDSFRGGIDELRLLAPGQDKSSIAALALRPGGREP